MGWNDHYCPSEYDAGNPDSMRALADRARAEALLKPDPTVVHPPIAEDAPDCWDCGRKVPNAEDYLHSNGQCQRCWVANKC